MTEVYKYTWQWPTSTWPFPMFKPTEEYSKLTPRTSTTEANSIGVRFMHLQGDTVSCTVAYRPLVKHKNSTMLEVAVAYKHKKDQYCRKIGAELAADRFLEGNTITMPIRGSNNTETMRNIAKIFLYDVQQLNNNKIYW